MVACMTLTGARAGRKPWLAHKRSAPRAILTAPKEQKLLARKLLLRRNKERPAIKRTGPGYASSSGNSADAWDEGKDIGLKQASHRAARREGPHSDGRGVSEGRHRGSLQTVHGVF